MAKTRQRVQTRGGGPAGQQRPAADADRGRTRDPTLDAETVPKGADRSLFPTTSSRITRSHGCGPGDFPLPPGSQYAAEAYRTQFADMTATPSMSRTGCCVDNAPMESFFHTLKVELVHQRRWATRDEVRGDLFVDSEGYDIGSASARHSVTSRPSRSNGMRANPVSVRSGEDRTDSSLSAVPHSDAHYVC